MMTPSNADVLTQVIKWLRSFSPVWLATVADCPDRQAVGAIWAWAPDFGMTGSLAGCQEEDLRTQLKAGVLEGPFPRMFCFGEERDGQMRHGIRCEGNAKVILERLTSADVPDIDKMLNWLADGHPFVRHISLHRPSELVLLDTPQSSVLTTEGFRHAFDPDAWGQPLIRQSC